MHFLVIMSLLFLISCCPKEGIDRSRTVNDYILAIDYYNDNTPVNAHMIPTQDVALQVENSDQEIFNATYIEKDTQYPQRLIYHFDSSLTEDHILSLSGKLSGYVWNQVDFGTFSKSTYQKTPEILASNDSLGSQFLCLLNNIGHTLLPSANAMSCKTKAGSQVTYRAGTLIRIDL